MKHQIDMVAFLRNRNAWLAPSHEHSFSDIAVQRYAKQDVQGKGNAQRKAEVQ